MSKHKKPFFPEKFQFTRGRSRLAYINEQSEIPD